MQYSGIQYLYSVVQPLLPSSSKTSTSSSERTLRLEPMSSHSRFPPAPRAWQLLSCFLSLWICLFWLFHTRGIIQCVTLCTWLFGLSMVFLRFLHAAARVHWAFLLEPANGSLACVMLPFHSLYGPYDFSVL